MVLSHQHFLTFTIYDMWDDYRPLSGLTARLVQRATALYMLLFVLFVPGFLSFHPKHSYAQRIAWIGQPAISIAVFVFFTALLSHMWGGLRDVLFDYARPCWLTPSSSSSNRSSSTSIAPPTVFSRSSALAPAKGRITAEWSNAIALRGLQAWVKGDAGSTGRLWVGVHNNDAGEGFSFVWYWWLRGTKPGTDDYMVAT